MKLHLLKIGLTILLLSPFITNAQFCEPKINEHDPNLPSWVKLMYADHPNVYAVDEAFKAYTAIYPDEQTVYTGYYNRWRRAIAPFINENGMIVYPAPSQLLEEQNRRIASRGQNTRNNIWSFAGPVVHYTPRYSAADPSITESEQANCYSIDQSQSNPQILFSGTEAGGVYKSSDKGITWSYVTPNVVAYDVRSVRIDPTNPDVVLFGSSGKIWKTTDGGITWNPTGDATFQSMNIHTWDLLFHPTDPNIIFAATSEGLYRTTDAGNNWTEILPNECHTVIFKAGDPSVVFTMEYDPASEISYFYKSTDTGLTFSIKTTGWFEVPAADQGKIQSYGGRLAATVANPDKIYALLVGESQSTANLQLNGFIGIYVSNDGGETWTFPQGYMGAPYDANVNPNPMTFSGDNNPYNQIYYNTTIAVSQLDENKILFGGLSLWSSDNGAASYFAVGGYVGNIVQYQHVDMQQIISVKTGANSEEVWIASDGGVNYSTDFYASHESRMAGIAAGEFWGFDQGWNEDIMVGGRYHNGDAGYYENYPQGSFIAMGGGEAPTGYVNYSDERKTYFSDIGGRILPEQIDDEIKTFNSGTYANESYWINGSSRVVFDPRYWNVCYMGEANKMMKSTDGGASFAELHAFGTNTNSDIYWFEQCFSNPDIMYAQQVVGSWTKIWKTMDGGNNWSQVAIPQTNKRNVFFTMSYTNENELWIAYTDGANGAKVYHTLDGGTNWTNLTTALLDNLHIWAIAYQAGTDGGVYIATVEGDVFYRNNSMTDWTPYSTGLPVTAQPLRIVPFYKGQKIRLATWDIAIWEAPFYEPSTLIGDFAADYASFYCPGDTVHFVDHSVSTSNATYQWTFPGGIPSTSTLRSPKVVYQTEGSFDVTEIITDGNLSDTIVKTAVVHSTAPGSLPLAEGFENGFDELWNPHPLTNGGSSWGISGSVGGYSNSDQSMYFDNYNNDLQGGHADVWTSKLNFSALNHAILKFDVAYAQYASNYSDTLAVFVSADCGATFTMVYYHGGDDLSTAPDYTDAMFVPSASQWRTDTVNLDAFLGQPDLLISFQNRGYWGQAMYVDNVNINDGSVGINEMADTDLLNVFPNPGNGAFLISFQTTHQGAYTLRLLNSLGENIYTETLPVFSGLFSKQLHETLSAGVYLLEVEGNGEVYRKKVVVQ